MATSGRKIYRSRSTTRWAIISTATAVGCAVIAFIPARIHVFGWVAGPLFLVAAWRMWASGIRVGDAGVRMVSYFGSRQVGWDEIDHFAVLPLGQYPYVGHVVLSDGRTIGCLALAAPGWPKRESSRLKVQEPIDELNQILAARHGRAHGARPSSAG
jgi:hypothetical protein